MELQQAITKVEQGGSADGLLQVNLITNFLLGTNILRSNIIMQYECTLGMTRSGLIAYNQIWRNY